MLFMKDVFVELFKKMIHSEIFNYQKFNSIAHTETLNNLTLLIQLTKTQIYFILVEWKVDPTLFFSQPQLRQRYVLWRPFLLYSF
jgi:hypothetical protein